MALDPALVKTIEDVLDSLQRMEKQYQKVDRNKILTALEFFEKIDVSALRDAVEALQQIELDMRMTRLRIHALTGVQTPRRTDPDQTPVEPLIRRKSSATIARVDPGAKKP